MSAIVFTGCVDRLSAVDEKPANVASATHAVTGMDGVIEYAIDAPWRMEPRGAAPDYTFEPVPIQISFFDEAFAYESNGYRFGQVCDLNVTEYSSAGSELRAVTYLPQQFAQIERTGGGPSLPHADNTTSDVSLTRPYWELNEAPPWRGFCRPAFDNDCLSQFSSVFGTTEWHATVHHEVISASPGRRQTMRLELRIARQEGICSDPGDLVTFTNWVNVHFAEAPLPRFDTGWTYGDLHYHSQGTDNEGEAGYSYRGAVQAMSALGLDFSFATDHASNGQMIADMRADVSALGELYDSGSIIRGLRDMDETRFGDHAVLLQRIDNLHHDMPRLRTGAYPHLFLGGEVDVIPEIDTAPRIPTNEEEAAEFASDWMVPYGNGKMFDLTGMCDTPFSALVPDCDLGRLIHPIGDGTSAQLVMDRQGLNDYFGARQHLIYLPRASQRQDFVASDTSRYGGGTRRLSEPRNGKPGIAQEIDDKGDIAFLAHPLSGGGTGPGPGIVPYTPRQLEQAFVQRSIVGLQFWNQNDRLATDIERTCVSATIGNFQDSEYLVETGYSRSLYGTNCGTPSQVPGWTDGSFELRPQPSMNDTYAWRWEKRSNHVDNMLHNGSAMWDDMLLWGLDRNRTDAIDWLEPGQPRRVLAAGGSDAHGDFNYRRVGYTLETEEVTDNAFGKVRNLVHTGSLVSGDLEQNQENVVGAIKAGRLTITDGPALRIAIDRNNQNGTTSPVIRESDLQMGGVLHIEPGDSLPVLVEWETTAEFGPIEAVDLYVGVHKSGLERCAGSQRCNSSRVYAPIDHGTRGEGSKAGSVRYPQAPQNRPRLLKDGYYTPASTSNSNVLRIVPGVSEMMHGTRRIVLDLNQFPIGSYRGDRFYVRAFARTRSEYSPCTSSNEDTRDDAIRRGRCDQRYAITNPVWALEPTRGVSWAARAGGTSQDVTYATEFDSRGNLVVGGEFRGTADFGGTTRTAQGANEGFVAVYSPVGTLVWVRQLGGNGSKYVRDVAVDEQGNVYVTGFFSGEMRMDRFTTRAATARDAFVLKLDANTGDTVWWSFVGGENEQHGEAITVAPDGRVYIAGTYRQAVNNLLGTYQSEGGYDCYAGMIPASGGAPMLRPIGGTGYCFVTDLESNAAGDLLLTGYLSGQIVLDPWGNRNATTYWSDGGRDGYVVSYGANLNFRWGHYLGGRSGLPGDAYMRGIGTDGAGHVYIAGQFRDHLSIGNNEDGLSLRARSAGNDDIVVVEFDADGSMIAEPRTYGGPRDDRAYAIDVAQGGHYCISGQFYSEELPLGESVLTRTASYEGFVASFDRDNNILWADDVSGSGYTAARTCAVAENGNVGVGGHFQQTMVLAEGLTLSNGGGWDVGVSVYALSDDPLPPLIQDVPSDIDPDGHLPDPHPNGPGGTPHPQ